MERNSPTVLVGRRVVPGKEAAFAEWMARMTQAAQSAEGHVAADVQRPDSTHPDEWMIVYRFEDADSLDRWLGSDVRQNLMDQGADLILGKPREQIFAAAASDPGVRMVTSYLLKEGGSSVHRAVHEAVMAELLGDYTYGKAARALSVQSGATRQMLHARKLSFKHPITQNDLVIASPIPPDMTAVTQLLREIH